MLNPRKWCPGSGGAVAPHVPVPDSAAAAIKENLSGKNFTAESVDELVKATMNAWNEIDTRNVSLPGFDFEPAGDCGTMEHPDLRMHCLPYVPGVITAKEVTEVFTLTGRFTGCLCSIFRFKNKVYLGHLGTIEKGVENWENINAGMKSAWKEATKLKDVFEVMFTWDPSEDVKALLTKTPRKWKADRDPLLNVYAGAIKDGNTYKPYTVTFADCVIIKGPTRYNTNKKKPKKSKYEPMDINELGCDIPSTDKTQYVGMQFLDPTPVIGHRGAPNTFNMTV